MSGVTLPMRRETDGQRDTSGAVHSTARVRPGARPWRILQSVREYFSPAFGRSCGREGQGRRHRAWTTVLGSTRHGRCPSEAAVRTSVKPDRPFLRQCSACH